MAMPGWPRFVRLVGSVAVLSLGVAGCTDGADTDSPVPETATAPFACPGVPMRGAELMGGVDSLAVVEHSGTWGGQPGGFYCVLAEGDDEDQTVLRVEERTVRSLGAGPREAVLEQMRANTGVQRIEAAQPGEGYVWPSGDSIVNAWWVCDDRILQVELFTRTFEGRDFLDDVSRYVSSMLPWACGGQSVPDDV